MRKILVLLKQSSVVDPGCLFPIPDPNISIPDPNISIPDPNISIPDPGSRRSRNFSIFNLSLKIISKLSGIRPGMFIPDPDFFPTPDPDPGSRSQKSTRSRIRIRSTDAKMNYSIARLQCHLRKLRYCHHHRLDGGLGLSPPPPRPLFWHNRRPPSNGDGHRG